MFITVQHFLSQMVSKGTRFGIGNRRDVGATALKKPTIAVLGTRGPCTAGGIQTICLELYPLLTEAFNVTIYTRAPYVDPKLKALQGMRLIHLPTVHNKFLEATVHTFLATIHAVFSNADILHFHAQGPALFTGLARLLAPKKAVVFTAHGLDWQRDKWTGPASIPIRLGEWCSARFAHQLSGCSQALVIHYQQTYQRAMALIPNGTWLFEETPAEEITIRWGLKPKQYLLCMGRLVPEKAVHEVIEAYRNLSADERGGMPLVVAGRPVGTGDYAQRLYDLAGNDPEIIFTGFVSGALRDELFTNAAAYVSASHLEGLPLTVLQALASGLPVLLSDIAPHLEVTDHKPERDELLASGCVRYFVTGNLEALKTDLAGFIETINGQTISTQSNSHQAMPVAAMTKNFIAQHYLWSPIAQQYQDFYHQALHQRAQDLQGDLASQSPSRSFSSGLSSAAPVSG